MEHRALLISIGVFDKDLPRLNKVAGDSGFELLGTAKAHDGLTLLKSRVRAGRIPQLILIGSDTEEALNTAKAIFRLAPGAHIVFAVTNDDLQSAYREIADSSMDSSNWSVIDLYSADLAEQLSQLMQPLRRHQQLSEILKKFNRQILQHSTTEPSEYRKLLASEKYLNTLLSVTPNAVIAVTPDDDIVSWNRSAAALFGIDEDEAVRKKITSLADQTWHDTLATVLQTCLTTRQRQHAELECTINNVPLYVEVWALPIGNDADAGRLTSVIVRDVTESKRQEQALRFANEELERSNMELQQFAYIASHDLQSPLRSISGFLQLLRGKYHGKLDAEAEDWIGHTISNVEKLKTLIGDLLRYSRVESRARPFKQVDFNEVFDSALVMLGASIRDAQATVTRNELPVVSGDSSQLSQLLLNLISNAIKYQGEHPPVIHVSAERTGYDWVFSVSDNGMGIEPRHGERIFEIFRRLHTDRTYPGTGIGLAVCRRVVLRHGGRIWMEPNPGGGSVFYFTLPASQGSDDGNTDTH